MTSHVILLGLGGLSLDVLDPLIHNGWVPNLEYLLGRGVVGPLSSDLPPYASAEWASLLTGESPGTTGFIEGCRKTPGSYFPEIANLQSLASRAPRSLLARKAPETVLVGVPLPASPGPLPPEDSIQVLRWQVDRFTVRSLPLSMNVVENDGEISRSMSSECFLEGAIRRMIALSVSISRMVRESGPRMVAIHFAGLDRVLSRFHKEIHSAFLGMETHGLSELLRQFFRVFDDAVGTVVDLSYRSGILVVLASAHGYVPLKRVLNLNAFLISRGDLGIRPDSGKEALLREVAAPMLRTIKIQRGHVRRMFDRPVFKDAVDQAGSLFSSEIGLFDWTRTRAFALTRTGITLNVRGVESKGTVNPGPEERAIGEEIKHALLNLVDPVTGKKPVKKVVWRDEIFEGPGISELPHLIIRDWDPEYALDDWRKVSHNGSVFSNPDNRSGAPRSPGFYCFSGSAIPERVRFARSLNLPELAEAIITTINPEPTPLKNSLAQNL